MGLQICWEEGNLFAIARMPDASWARTHKTRQIWMLHGSSLVQRLLQASGWRLFGSSICQAEPLLLQFLFLFDQLCSSRVLSSWILRLLFCIVVNFTRCEDVCETSQSWTTLCRNSPTQQKQSAIMSSKKSPSPKVGKKRRKERITTSMT